MPDHAWASEAAAGARRVLVLRVLTALCQAAALYLITAAARMPLSWPATHPAAFVALLLVSCFVPLLILFGLGQVRPRPLLLWACAAAVAAAGLGVHDALRGRVPDFHGPEVSWPSFPLWIALAASLFVAHVLVIDSIIERRLVSSYPRHFDTSWKVAVQSGLAIAFVGVFWGVLELGAGLFKLVDVDFFRRLIGRRWFVFPATTLALAVAIHATDVQPALIRGARSMALALFSWLLPLLAAILLGFLASLPFISLAPLWKTHFATLLLLTAAILLVILINSCYQDGAAEQTRSRIKRGAVRVAAIELLPLVGLAAYALWLRIGQYGLTVERIQAAAVIVLVACYAAGYATASLRSPAWMQRMEVTNRIAAWLFIAVVLTLFSPLADPARLMVADQVARLRSGAVSADTFDFGALKFDGARWGAAALEQMARATEGAQAAPVADRARRALALQNRYEWNQAALQSPTADALAQRIVVRPAGRALPPTFVNDALMAPYSGAGRPNCTVQAGPVCIARFVDLGQGRAEAIVFIDAFSNGFLFESGPDGRWLKSALLQGNYRCAEMRSQFEEGQIRLQPHPWPDLLVGGRSIEIQSFPAPCGPP